MSIKQISINGESVSLSNFLINNNFNNTDNILCNAISNNNQCCINIKDSNIEFHKYDITKGQFDGKSTYDCGIGMQDDLNYTNPNSLAKLEMYYDSVNKCSCAQLMAYLPIVDAENFNFIRCLAYNDGTLRYSTASSPELSSNHNELATTKWVRDLLSSKGL